MRTSTVGRALRHQHWLISSLALIAGGLALIAAFMRPPTYEATALLSIDESQQTNQGFELCQGCNPASDILTNH